MRVMEIRNHRIKTDVLAWLESCDLPSIEDGIDYHIGRGWRINERFETDRSDPGRFSILRIIWIEFDDDDLATEYALRFR